MLGILDTICLASHGRGDAPAVVFVSSTVLHGVRFLQCYEGCLSRADSRRIDESCAAEKGVHEGSFSEPEYRGLTRATRQPPVTEESCMGVSSHLLRGFVSRRERSAEKQFRISPSCGRALASGRTLKLPVEWSAAPPRSLSCKEFFHSPTRARRRCENLVPGMVPTGGSHDSKLSTYI